MAHRKVMIASNIGTTGTQAIGVSEQASLFVSSPRFALTAISADGGHFNLLAGWGTLDLLQG